VQNEKVEKDRQTATAAPQAGWGSWLGSIVWSNAPTVTAPSPAGTNIDGFWESIHLTEDEQSQLFDAIHFESSSSQSTKSRLAPPESYIKYKLYWQQDVGQLRLDDDLGGKLVNFAFFGLNARLHSKDNQNLFDTSLSSIILTDCTSTITHFPRIVYPHNLLPNDPLLRMNLVLNSKSQKPHSLTTGTDTTGLQAPKTPQKSDGQTPSTSSSQSPSTTADNSADWSLDFFLHKLNIVWNTQLAMKVLDLFLPKGSTASPDPSIPAQQQETAGTWSKGQGDNAWISWTRTKQRNEQLLALSKLKPSSNIRIHLEAPNLLIPENCAAINSSILVMELGTFKMATAMSKHRDGLRSPSTMSPSNSAPSMGPMPSISATLTPSTAQNTRGRATSLGVQIVTSSPMHTPIPVHKSVDVSEYYDIYSFSVTNIRAFVTRTERIASNYGLSPPPETLASNKPLSKCAHIINPFGFSFSLAVCKINVESMPNIKLTASLPYLRLMLSSPKLLTLKALLASTAKQFPSTQQGSSIPSSAPPATSFKEPFSKPDNPVTHFVEDWSYTQSLASKTDRPEEEVVAVGLGISIELDAPEIEVTLVHKPQTRSGEGHYPTATTPERATSQKKPRDLVRLKLTDLGYRLESYPKMIQASSFLRTLSIEDFTQGPQSPFQYLVNSEVPIAASEDYLAPIPTSLDDSPLDRSLIHITFTHRVLDTATPSDELQNHCKLRFNALQVNLALGTISDIYDYVYQLTSSQAAAPITDAIKPTHLERKISNSQPVSHIIRRPSDTSSVSPKQDRLKLLLEIECHAILINFVENNSHPLAEISLRRSSATLKIIENKGYLLEAKLGNMKVLDTLDYGENPTAKESSSPGGSEDPLAQSSRRHVISVRGPHVIEFLLTNIVPEGATPKTQLDVTIHSIRVLVNPKWVFTMVLNVGELIAVFTVPRERVVAKNVQTPVPEPLIDYMADPMFFNYRVKIMCPYIIFPQDQTSSAMLITDWGEIEVANSFQEVPYIAVPADSDQFVTTGCRKIKEKISVSLRKANISSGQLCTQAEDLTPTSEMVNTRRILGDTDITIAISNTFIAHTMIPRREHSLDVHIGEVKIFLSPEQLTFLLLVVQNSLFYQPTEAEIRRKLQAALLAESIEQAASGAQMGSSNTSSSLPPTEVGTVRFQLDRITVEAHDHYQLFPSTDRRFISVVPQNVPKILSMEIINSKVAWTNLSDFSIRLGFQIASLSITDLRPRSSRTNIANAPTMSVSPRESGGAPVLLPAPAGSKKSQLVGSCITLPSKGQFSVSVTLNDMQFLPEASFIQQTRANLGPLLMHDLMGLLAHRERIMVSTLTPRQEKQWRDQRFHPEAGSTYLITLNRPQIVLSTEENSGVSSWLKFVNLTSSSCEISMKFMSSLQSYDVKLNQLSISAGETYDTSMLSLFQASQFQPFLNPAVALSPLLDHSIYHYNLLSPFSATVRAIILPDAHDFQLEFQDQAKISLSYNDYSNILSMIAPYGKDHTRRDERVGHPVGLAQQTSQTSTVGSKTKLKLKIKESDIGNIPSISDGVEYRLVKTEAKYQATAASGANTAKGSTADPKRATDYWANLDLERKKSTIQVPDLTLGTAPSPTALSSSSSKFPSSDNPVEGTLEDEAVEDSSPNQTPVPIIPFVHKKLMVFNCKVQVMVMDNREYDLGLIRTEILTEECWLQDWDVDAYAASLPSQYLESITADSKDHLALPHKKAAIRATLSADSFNIKAATWEPLLDPFFLDIGLTDKTLVVKSEASLNLTISETFLSSYKRFRRALDDRDQNPVASAMSVPGPTNGPVQSIVPHLGGSESVDSPRLMTATRNRIQAPYYVKNETGLSLKYRLFTEDSSLPPAEERTLASGAEEPVVIPAKWATKFAESVRPTSTSAKPSSPIMSNKHHLDRSAQSWASKHLSLTAHVDLFLAAPNLALDHIGTQIAHIGHGRLLVIDIQYRLGAKLITFKSRISIHNNTSVALVVGKEIPANFESRSRSTSQRDPMKSTYKDDSVLRSRSHDTDCEPPRKSLDSARPRASPPSLSASATPSTLPKSRPDYQPVRASLDGSEAAPTKPSGGKPAPTIKTIATIEPFGVFCLPLDCMVDTVLRFRPGDPSSTPSASRAHTGSLDETQVGLQSGETNLTDLDSMKFSWSHMRCDVKNLKAMEPIFVDCFPKQMRAPHGAPGAPAPHNLAPDLSSTFQYSVGVSKLANKSAILAGADLLVMHFQPPLILENLLPASMTFSLEPQPPKASDKPSMTFLPKVGRLKKGQKIPIHQMPAQCPIAFRMLVRGFEWSTYVLLRDPEISGPEAILRAASQGTSSPNTDRAASSTPSRLHSHIHLTDSFGKRLQVQIENRVNEVGTRTVSFYTKFWIVNKIGLPLMARAHSSNPASIGAGMLGLYASPNASSADMIDERNGLGVYGGGDLRDLFMADLSSGCLLNTSTSSSGGSGSSDGENSRATSSAISTPWGSQTSLSSLSHRSANENSEALLGKLARGDDTPREITLEASAAAAASPGTARSSAGASSSGKPTASTKAPPTAKPIMYYPSGFENNRFHIKVAESRWSDAIVLNTQNDSTVLSVQETEDAARHKRKYEVALVIRPAANQFWRTRVVTLAPRYMLLNKTGHSLFLRQVNSSYVCTLLPGEHAPLHWMDVTKGLEKFRLKLNLPKCTWSGPIDPTQLEIFSLKLFNAETGLRYLIRVMVRLHPETAITTITIKEEDMNAPLFRIDNYTKATLMVRQLNVAYATEAIPPLSRRVWGWLEPAYQSHRVQVLFNTQDKVGLSFSLAKVKVYPPIQFQTRDGKMVWVLAETSTDRTTRVLTIRPIIDPQLERFRRRSSAATSGAHIPHKGAPNHPNFKARGSPSMSSCSAQTSSPAPMDSNYDDEEVLQESLRLHVQLFKVSVSLINAEPMELIYGSLSSLDLTYVNYTLKWSVDLRIGDIQVDNQIPTTFFPVAVFSLGDAPRDWLRFSMIRSYEYADIIYQPFVSLLLRATTIRMDETLLLKLLDLTGVTLASFNEAGKTALLTSNVDVLSLGDDEDASKMIYNHVYLLNPVALSISYLSSASTREAYWKQADREKLMSASYSYTTTGLDRKQTNAILGVPDKFIPNVESAPLNLNALLLKHSFVSSDQLVDRILQHYKSQLMRQMYAILGSFEALGNPISLVSNLGMGVKDLFYEPAKGIAISPEEFGAGLRRGGASFVSKSVGGLFNSTSQVLRAVGSGMAFISLDDDYQAKRDLAKRREQPRNALTGVATGLKEFGEGLIEGVAGVFVQPVRGFQQEGMLGMVKGVGKGIVGVAVKPVVGTLDLVQRTTEGISNTASANVLLRRARYPRYLSEDGVIRPFDAKQSLAMHMLHSIENAAFAHEDYWGYILVSLPKAHHPRQELLGWILIASSHRIALVSRLRPVQNPPPASSSQSTTPSAAPSQISRAPPSVQTHWIVTYPSITAVEKFHEANGSLKLKLSSRNEDATLITHTLSCIDVTHLMQMEAFIMDHMKKWQAFTTYISSLPDRYQSKAQRK
jgi:hypothetical protein